jgi:hypothetical protein
MQNQLDYRRLPLLLKAGIRLLIEGRLFYNAITWAGDFTAMAEVIVVISYLVGTVMLLEVINLGVSFWRHFEAAALNAASDALLLPVGLLQRRQLLLPLESTVISKTDKGLVVSYERAFILKRNGVVLQRPGGSFAWRDRDFAPDALAEFGAALRGQHVSIGLQSQRPVTRPRKHRRRWIIITVSVLLALVALVFVARYTFQTYIRTGSAYNGVLTMNTAKKYFSQGDYQPGKTLQTTDYTFKFNKGAVAWDSEHRRVAVINITMTARKTGGKIPNVTPESFSTMTAFSFLQAKNSQYKPATPVATVAKDGQNVKIVNRLTTGGVLTVGSKIGDQVTYNLALSIPETGKTFSMYYRGFDFTRQNAPKKDEDSSFVLTVKQSDLEAVHE